MTEVVASGFPREFDGQVWVSALAVGLFVELDRTGAGEVTEVRCIGTPVFEGAGVRVDVALVLADGELLEGVAVADDEGRVSFEASSPPARLRAIVDEARRLVELEGNDFTWSSWADAAEAAAELAAAEAPADLAVAFAPTGPLQELALSSGWGDEYLRLADRFDAVATAFG